ncbi:MAG TPA: Ig-like domain-containing protein [Solirubrobacteraceae bacterium]|nr:Ig-like domain-containing protein [Solirubrobacteraceae bacterium]
MTVNIYAGSKAEGTVMSSASASGTGGGWSSGEASPALSSGTYTAQATQPSSLGNAAGKSNSVTFVVSTASPTVSLNQPPSPSNNTKPSFSGEASESTTVTVKIYKGSKAEGTVVSSATASGTGGGWSSGEASPALSSGTYSAIATQPSSFGNPAGKSTSVTFVVNTASPTVSLNHPPSPSNNTTPSFSGEASETTAVTVKIYEGSKAEGTVVSSAAASGTGGGWSSGEASPALSSGTYTAIATQPSSLGNPAGTSNSVTFTINTASPTVTLIGPPSPSNNTKPSFSGEASETTPVTVKIYEGFAAEGTAVSSATASGTGGGWSSGEASPALSSGTYTAIATQPSSLGNPAGKSNSVTFVVNTASPTVSLNQPSSPSNNTKPSFSGEASESTTVTVKIYEGSKVEGTVVSSATASGTGGGWSSGQASPALSSGTYTAIATQPSPLGNPAGKSNSVTFVVSTASPTVTLTGPPSPSNNTKPSFSGEASESTTVTVKIYEGSKAEGTVVSTATASATGGGWTSGEASPALSSGTYTAIATQPSSLGNPAGKSNSVTFNINTAAPSVTLEQPPTPSKNQRPSFIGTASEYTQVIVKIYKGSKAEGTAVSTATASGTGGGWSSGEASPALESGEYTAVAVQESSLGNGTGHSNTVSFIVNTKPPTVSLHQPAPLSNDTTPSFTGFASDATSVTVKIYSGSNVVAEATANGNGGEWVSEEAHPALASGKYTAIATQPSSLGNSPGTSETVSFTVETGPPHVTLKQPTTPSNHTTPSFTGTATDHTPVIVDIYSGATAKGQIVSEATATGTGGTWTSGAASTVLATGEYTAVATQESSLGNPPGSSSPVSFVVDTRSPTVTIEQPAALSNNAKPTFKGEASDSTPVVVHIVNKANAEVANFSTTPGSGHWSTNGEGTLSSESYSAYATQESSLGNPPGESTHVAFMVETRAPTVALNPSSVALRSNNTAPSFNGTATDTTTVTVHVFAGNKPEGTPVATAIATGTGGAWSSPSVSPALSGAGPHTYTAIAEQPSSLENPTGRSNSVTFTVDTSAPTVTLAQPITPSNNTAPSFTGTASESTPVTVRIYEEPKENEKKKIAELPPAAVSGASWSTGATSPALPAGTHKYSAVAIEPSAIGNPPGESAPVKFTVDTTAPKVTLAPPITPSNNTLPTFSGTASDTEPVTVAVYELNKAERKLVATAEAREPKTTWTSQPVTTALPAGNHDYAAVASQKSSIGNPTGASNEITFTVDTTSPVLTITAPPSPSNNLTPVFSGTSTATHASTEVAVKIYLDIGGVRGGEVSSAKATASAGKWTTGPVSPPLAKGTNTYTAVATQESLLLGSAPGTAEVTFTVNTEPPSVTLVGPPASSNNRTPVFEGTASDTTPVTLNVYEGKSTAGNKVASAVAVPGVSGVWKTQTTLPALKRTYTAIALEKSSIVGNHEGESKTITFIVDPIAPTVILTPPPTWVNSATPTFSGSASDNSPVKIKIYPGTKPEGPFVASEASATGTNGAWASATASPSLPDGQYTAVASQANSVTHVDVGTSTSATFNVDTVPPQVTLTSPATGSSSPNATETVSGAAGNEEDDLPHVTAQLFSGSSIGAGQVPVQSLTVNTVGKAWSGTFGGLSPGTYTVRAVQPDLAGNLGVSATSTFVVTGSSSSPSSSAARPSPPPAASFTWFPSIPSVGQAVSFVSNSTDSVSPITAFAWDPAGTGAFAAGGPAMSTTFSSAGNHRVQLRVTDANGLSSVASQMIPVSSSLPLMQPFPVVRIATTGTRSGVKLTLLSVLASPGAQITVQCRGRRCPLKLQTVKVQSHIAKSMKRTSGSVEFQRFERSLAAGVILEIRVSKAGVMGKYTRFVVRRGKLPLRFDACVAGLEAKPVGCPSS